MLFKRNKVSKPKDAQYIQPHTGYYFKQKYDYLAIWDGFKWIVSGYRFASDSSFLKL